MAVSLEKKLDLIRKANATLKKEKISNLLTQASKIDSYSTENQQKIKSNVDSLYNQIAEAYKKKQEAVSSASKPASKNRKKPKKEDTMMGYASMVMKRDNVSWKDALKKSKDHFASIRSKKQDEEQKALDDFKKKVGDVEFERATKYKIKNGTKGTDIERDKVRPALPSGKRIVRTKGQTTNQYGTFKNKIGKVYYEKRANRMDVNQPSKSVYPKLAKGGKFNDDLYFDQLASMSGTRAGAEKEWALSNSLSEIDLLNLMQGMGRSQISRADFSSAIVGDKKANSEIISYAKSGRGFKMAKGGEISEGNYDMAKNQAKELCHHATELQSVLKKEKHIEAWVISKLERATSDLSDVTHYLDGLSEQHKD